MNTLIENLHVEAKEKALCFRQAESAMVDVLMRLDEHKVFVALGYASLFEYCLRELHLAETHACNFIAVARKSRDIPELKKEIASGGFSVAKARKIIPVLTLENAKGWISDAKTLTYRELERAVAREKPEVLLPVGSRYISEDRLALQVGVTEEFMEQVAKVKDLLSQKMKTSVTLEKTLAVVVGEYLERHDPVHRANRALERQAERDANLPRTRAVEIDEPKVAGKPPEANTPALSTKNSNDRFGSAALARDGLKQIIKHGVMHRDQGRCTYVYPNGRRCKEQRFLEMHHIKPVSEGGPDTLENLTLLCSAHHRHMHFKGHGPRAIGSHTSQQQSLGMG